MSDEVVVQPEVTKLLEEDPQPGTVHLVAVNAQQMASAQAKLTIWLEAKLHEVRSEIEELTLARNHARAQRWRTTTFQNQINRAEKRLMFYSKLHDAAEAGYTIIPNMPIDLLAVKVETPEPSDTSRQTWHRGAIPANHLAEKADILPSGEGTYVAPIPTIRRSTSQAKDSEGKPITQFHATAIALKDMEFPVSVAIPSIMDATARAMALKIFDQIGICPAKGLQARSYRTQQLPSGRDPDPLIIGQILSPQNGYSGRRPVSFLIAWHLDLRSL
jgi:hypothetical protein